MEVGLQGLTGLGTVETVECLCGAVMYTTEDLLGQMWGRSQQADGVLGRWAPADESMPRRGARGTSSPGPGGSDGRGGCHKCFQLV